MMHSSQFKIQVLCTVSLKKGPVPFVLASDLENENNTTYIKINTFLNPFFGVWGLKTRISVENLTQIFHDH